MSIAIRVCYLSAADFIAAYWATPHPDTVPFEEFGAALVRPWSAEIIHDLIQPRHATADRLREIAERCAGWFWIWAASPDHVRPFGPFADCAAMAADITAATAARRAAALPSTV